MFCLLLFFETLIFNLIPIEKVLKYLTKSKIPRKKKRYLCITHISFFNMGAASDPVLLLL